MKTLANTLERETSSSYSDDVNSNEMATLPMPSSNALIDCDKSQADYYYKHLEYATNYSSKRLLKCTNGTIAFWTIVIILLVLTVSNLILTLTIIGVLRLGRGIHGIELIPEENIIKFYGISDLDRIHVKNIGNIGGFINEPVSVTSDHAPVNVRIHHRNGQINNRLVMDKFGVQFRGTNVFDIKDPENGCTIFTSHRPHYNIPKGVDMLITKTVSASRISSAINASLLISTLDNRVAFKGSEGIHMDADTLKIQAENNVYINLTQGGDLTLLSGSGIYLDINKIPIVKAEMGLRTGSVQYKLCICMPQGIIFRLTIPRIHNSPKVSCASFNPKRDPCAIN